MVIELEAGLIVIRALDVVIERPAAPAAMDKVPELVLLPRPEPLYAASLARRAPLVGEEVTFLVERSRELISAVSAACGELMVAREFQSNSFH